MKRLLLVASCLVLSACSTYGPAPRSSLGYDAAPVSGYYGGGYSSYYSSSARLRGSVIGPYGGYDPYYFGSGRTMAFGYSPHYYRDHGFGHSSGIALGLGYDWLHRSSYFGGQLNSLGYGSGYRGHSLGHGARHRRGH
jgi:hypothetical protein